MSGFTITAPARKTLPLRRLHERSPRRASSRRQGQLRRLVADLGFRVRHLSPLTLTAARRHRAITINVGQLLAPWLQGLIAAAVAVIMALFGWITTAINKRAGLEGNAAVMQMEEYARNALDSGLTTAAGWIIMKAGPELDKMSFDVKSPLIVQGVTVLNNLAGDAIKKFGLTPDDLAKKLIAKIGVVTAPNPSVAPSTTVTAPTA
jgi:hypothetical protein